MAVKKRPKSLTHGRPSILKSQAVAPRSLTSKATRTLIRTHHRLQKEHAAALKAGNQDKADNLAKQIEANGGLELYQAASMKGQSAERGGDSSQILVEWLREDGMLRLHDSHKSTEYITNRRYRVLEVGALSTTNAISRHPSFDVTRIDLHSQDPGIQTQDFMERPLPTSANDEFDILSLSLVLNYVPEASARGEMLRRTCSFLWPEDKAESDSHGILPVLFLVLPAPCVMNSRYLTEEHLQSIMVSLGFVLLHKKLSAKLVYYLWKCKGPKAGRQKIPKKKIHDGKTRNNFCIILE